MSLWMNKKTFTEVKSLTDDEDGKKEALKRGALWVIFPFRSCSFGRFISREDNSSFPSR